MNRIWPAVALTVAMFVSAGAAPAQAAAVHHASPTKSAVKPVKAKHDHAKHKATPKHKSHKHKHAHHK